MKKLLLTALFGLSMLAVDAQRVVDKLDRGLVAVPGRSSGNLVTWRIFGSEYYDVTYNLYRNGTKINDTPLTVSNFQDTGGNSNSTYQVAAVVRGVEQAKSESVKAWATDNLIVNVKPCINRNGQEMAFGYAYDGSNGGDSGGYTINDISLADVDGDGVCEFMVKRNNAKGNLSNTSNTTDFNIYECYNIKGDRLWWIDLGPNLMSNPDEQYDMIGYDWDCDGKAEFVMRGADNMIIHTSTGKVINIGDMTFDSGSGLSSRPEYVAVGAEYLLYLNGETGEPYGWDGSDNWTPQAFPLPRFEANETVGDADVWGDLGHRATKIYMGAPYLDGVRPSIFFGRGCYTRHKACALDVNPTTHEIIQRWRWNCYDSASPWFGNGFHNFAIADVDLDGRDEIVYGSMILDDTGYGLATTGLGHGDAQHCGDLDPYRWGLEQFTCQEGSQGNSYWNATTGELYYRKADGGDDGRSMAGNFTNDYPGSQGKSATSGSISLTADKVLPVSGVSNLNNRIYWDDDLLEEMFDSKNGANRTGNIFKWNAQNLKTFDGVTNNWTKCNPSAQGDIIGDWREEIVLRQKDNMAFIITTTNYPTNYRIYTLWHDHQYRNAMAWQCVGYNQPPHCSFFLGELEGITVAPPALILEGRTEVANGATIKTTDEHLLISGYENKTISVQDGASPYILTVNAPVWVQGSGSQQATASTPKSPARTLIKYTTTLTGGAFAGYTRIIKQGEGTLVLPNVTQKHTGETNVWNGTLQFDGTFLSSPLWLNRHTSLVSNGGQFLGGIKADYNATIYPGGKQQVGSITATTLDLGFGSRVVFDVVSGTVDQLNLNTLKIEAKTSQEWLEFGPTYKAPVFQFEGGSTLAPGRYLLGYVGEVSGNIADIVLEGVSDKRQQLTVEDGKLYLDLETIRAAGAVVWNGSTTDNVWDFASTENFLIGGEKTYSATGDDVTFNDNAANTAVVIKGAVAPKSIVIDNNEKNYTFSGDSIVSGATITKRGTGTATMNYVNHTGATTIEAGRLVVDNLANRTGQTYGALGDYNQTITIADGATLYANGVIITDQPFNISGVATIDVASSKSLTLNSATKGAGATLVKSGTGRLTLGKGNTFAKLIISGGSVNAQNSNYVDQLPATVEFQNGTLWGTTMDDNPGITSRANFVVPQGKSGTYYGAYRGTNSGTLTGSGTFTFYSGGVRCYWDGDWSAFEGTVIPATTNRQAKPSYDPTIDYRNAKGLPKATLQLNDNVTFTSTNSIEIGSVTGTGALGGSVSYIIGGNNADMNSSFSSSCSITKRGTGYWQPSIGKITGAITVEEGTLRISDTKFESNYSGAVTLKNKGILVGSGLVPSITAEAGTTIIPRMTNGQAPRIIRAAGAMNIKEGATLEMIIRRSVAADASLSTTSPAHSQIRARYLTVNGKVKVVLYDSYTPAVGDQFTLWTATASFAGTPTFELPDLPEGMAWDTSGLTAMNGVLKIVEGTAIKRISSVDVLTAEVYSINGVRIGQVSGTMYQMADKVKQLGARPGLYILRTNAGTQTILVK